MIKAQDYTPLKNNGQLIALGDFVFELPSLVYQQLERQNSWRHPGNEPVGAHPTYQYTGPGAETIKLTGVLYKEFSNPGALDTLRDMADTGEAYVMVDANGRVFGFYVIDDIAETQTYMDVDGQPRRIDFNISLTRAKPANSIDNAAGSSNQKSLKS